LLHLKPVGAVDIEAHQHGLMALRSSGSTSL
jgi:hypothetical protein